MWQSRRWRHLLNIIDHLPRHSAFGESLANDEELAEELLKRQQDIGRRGPMRRMRDFTAEVELLSTLVDRVSELIHVVAASKGSKGGGKQIRHMPRPVTAMQRLLAKRRKEKHDSIVARVLPGRNRDRGRAPNRPSRPAAARGSWRERLLGTEPSDTGSGEAGAGESRDEGNPKR